VAGRRKRAATPVSGVVAVIVFAAVSMVIAPAARADPGTLQSQEWWISRLGLRSVWKISKGAGITVAVLDTGVKAAVGDLRGAVLAGFDTSGPGDARTDSDGHGTAMAVEIAGRGNDPGMLGVAPAAKILPVVVPPQNQDDHTAAALERLSGSTHPPQIVTMSYGTPGACPDGLQAAVGKAVEAGMILVASAGNEGSGTNESQSPANCAGVVAVGAYGDDLRPWPDSQRQPYVGLAGPGVHIVGYDPATLQTEHYDGTSDAAAIVSGSIAVVRAHFPHLSPRQIVARMIATARQFDGVQGRHSDVLGWGAARPHHALTDAVPANAPNPIYDALGRTAHGRSTSRSPSTSPSPSPSTASPSTASTGAASTGTAHTGRPSSGVTGLAASLAAAAIVLVAAAAFVRRRRRPGR
jgi:hypothetical protein